ncbi:Fur family zinc uptake transcriptional regulator [Methylopila capsulata]|uniref:Fur family zinc uptake transcriptional regulator n=1 Tax=Methylopila capsulata TaxID=61654 RepID=A0A9W6MTJ6_9HYPH|nr:transcriptional repressor [Methylopila capsulata]MBM7853383.1 Fur family zinc uptake transcriptional regulator [Methylopila capsulata]GLK57404.1 transcriptional repressor [Methylopila capsulata]
MTQAHATHDHADAFAGPDHDHHVCARDVIARAEALCAARGARLTEIRRRVLEALAADHAPAGAYEVIERLAKDGERRPAPITVYRALDFLLAHGFAHRIESRNAFVACSHDHGPDARQPVVFLICERCGAVGEAATPKLGAALDELTKAAGFRPRAPVIEIAGDCAHCRAAEGAHED